MTKPLIEQLAERAGIPAEMVADRRLLFNQQLSAILFELCAYLDEREKGKPEPPAVRINDEGECPNCWLPDGHEGACDHPLDEGDHIQSLEQQLAEARAELASRCDHHAAIHELNRELVEARQDRATGERISAESIESRSKLRAAEAELAKATAERDEAYELLGEWDIFAASISGTTNCSGRAALEAATDGQVAHIKVMHGLVDEQRERAEAAEAERDELKAQLAWEKAWDLHTKVAMGAVVDAARAFCFAQKQVEVSMFGPHLSRAESARATALACLREILGSVTAAAAKSPER